MADTSTITVRTSTNVAQKIAALAQAMDRSRNWVVEDALKQYLDLQAWQVEGIQAAQRSLEKGEGIAHEQVMAELDALVEEQAERAEPKP